MGLSGSAGSTPLRLRVEGASSPYLFGKLYSRTHLRSDRWYKLGRELLYGRLEDEKPFNTVRRLVQQEDYALRVIREAGAPGAKSYGFVELTPEREYMLVTEFLEGAVELGDAVVDDALIDEALHLIRILWDAGLAHRDIKPANLMVRDGHILLIDVAFAELRPTPWRQAVDLANMMLCLALRSSAATGLRPGTPAVHGRRDVGGVRRGPRPGAPVAAAPGAAGRRTRPPRRVPPPAARATPAHQGAAVDAPARRGRARHGRPRHRCSCSTRPGCSATTRPPTPRCTSTPSATRWSRCGCRRRPCPPPTSCPCVASLPVGWSFRLLTVNNGRSKITVNHDRAGSKAIDLRFADSCDVTGATEVVADVPGARRFERGPIDGTNTILTWYEVFPGGCATVRLSSRNGAPEVLEDVTAQAGQVIGFVSRAHLARALDERSDGRLQLDPPS